MNSGRKLIAAVAAGAALACVPAGTAHAAVSATLTDDANNPVALTPGAPAAIRNMSAAATGHVDQADAGSYRLRVLDPAGVAAAPDSPCWDPRFTVENKRTFDYHGNGTYTLAVDLFNDRNCAEAKNTVSYTWTVTAGVTLAAPAPTLPIRAANDPRTITQQFPFQGNPGASSYEIKYAKGAVVQPDGSLSSPALKDAFVNSTTGAVELIGAREPGTYTIVARARVGSYYSPWTAPVNFNLIAPFDLSSRSFPDSRGPSYQVRAVLGETTTRGRVTIAVANGKNGKKFRTLGKARISSKGIIKLRFRLARGTYRMRYSYAGSSTTAKGTVYEVIKIRRIIL
jgi:hypothetical protein